MFIDEPYFMTNEEWYYFETKDNMYKLTDVAPDKAIESYKEFYKQLNQKLQIPLRLLMELF